MISAFALLAMMIAAGDVVIMRVMYGWPIVGGPFAFGLSNQPNGTFLLIATAVFKNEPYT